MWISVCSGFFGWELFSTTVWGQRSGPSGDCLMGTGGEGADWRLVFTVTEPIALKLSVDSALPE